MDRDTKTEGLFKFSKEEVQQIKQIVESECIEFAGTHEVESGLVLLSKLIQCKIPGYATEETGKKIKHKMKFEEFENGGTIEAILKKICQLGMPLKSVPSSYERGMAEYYCKLGVMDELEANWTTVRNPNSTQPLRSAVGNYVLQNRHVWQNHNLSYIYSWKYRNCTAHGEEFEKESRRKEAQASFFAVLIDICNRYADYINKKHHDSLKQMIDFKGFKQTLIAKNDRTEFFQHVFTPLHWGENEIVWDEKQRAIMMIGEAGAGKTTQMEKLYWDEVKGNQPVLPVWIKIQELKEKYNEESSKLIAAIKEALGMYADWDEEIMEQGFLKLYLDGLNELLVIDRGVSTQNLVKDIKKLIASYPKLQICITDRSVEFMEGVVTAYACASMDEDDVRKYCTNYWGAEEADKIMKFINPEEPSNEWFWETRDTVVTPEKVNGLAKMVLNGKGPKDRTDFYSKYLGHILKRELKEKNDNRIPDLIPLLSYLAETMEMSVDYKSGKHIINIFKGNLSNNIEFAMEYFVLACRIPVLVQYDDLGYGFTYPEYYESFLKFDPLLNEVIM